MTLKPSKIMAAALSVMMCATVLTGCSKTEGSGSEGGGNGGQTSADVTQASGGGNVDTSSAVDAKAAGSICGAGMRHTGAEYRRCFFLWWEVIGTVSAVITAGCFGCRSTALRGTWSLC